MRGDLPHQYIAVRLSPHDQLSEGKGKIVEKSRKHMGHDKILPSECHRSDDNAEVS
jgi:hypothetical protein